jgi:acyl-CoA thioester hydrolase
MDSEGLFDFAQYMYHVLMPPIIHYGVAHPWLCDALGHLNTRNYHAMYDDALFVFLAIIGCPSGAGASVQYGFVDVRNELEYFNEVAAGAVIKIHTVVEKIGKKSMTVALRMTAIDDSITVSSMNAVMVCMDLQSRTPSIIPEELRTKISPFMAGPSLPDH